MADESEQTPLNAALLRQIPIVYFNNAQAQATEYELSLDLGYRAGPGQESEVAVRAVTSWEHAKRLRDLLDRLVKGYEQQAGPIREFPEPAPEVTNGDDEQSAGS
jgi:hypothetical protein